jgi:hypothetical protein
MPRLTLVLDISATQAVALAATAAGERTTPEVVAARGAMDLVRAITRDFEDQAKLLIPVAYEKATDDERVALIAQVKALASR